MDEALINMKTYKIWLIEWYLTPVSTVFKSAHIIHVFPGFH